MFLTIITFIVVLSVLVFVHELGHFAAARRFGVKAEEFGFGFPPRIWGIYRSRLAATNGDYANNKKGKGKWKQVWGGREVKDSPKTIYSINWIPLGGFVKIKGENGEGENESDSFASRPIWQRAVMLSAGVTMNIALAAAIITIGLMIGMPQALDGIGPGAKITDKKIQVVQILPDSPAVRAGIQLGDAIADINGQSFATAEKLQLFVGEHAGEELNYKISRERQEIALKITPEIIAETGKGGIGVAIVETGIVKYPLYLALWEGIKTTFFLVWAIIVAFFELLKGLLLGRGVSAELAGPVGIAALTGQAARMGIVYIMQFAAMLSINLAIINFFPFPALDGGRVLFLVIEKIKGSPVRRELEAAIHNTGFALLMLLILLVTFRDVAKFGYIFKNIFEKIF